LVFLLSPIFINLFPALLVLFRTLFASRLELVAENLALRQQLAVLNRTAKRPKLQFQDRLFWATLSSLWKNWRSALIIVKPDTVLRWHRQGFRLYWRWKSKVRNPGRPKIDAEIRALIRRMSRENPLWGSPRIQAELRLLGFNVAESTVAKYRVKVIKPHRRPGKPSFPIIPVKSRGSIFLQFPPPLFVTFTASSSFCTTDDKSFISMSQLIRPLPGQPSK
jgi:hypothetical protein